MYRLKTRCVVCDGGGNSAWRSQERPIIELGLDWQIRTGKVSRTWGWQGREAGCLCTKRGPRKMQMLQEVEWGKNSVFMRLQVSQALDTGREEELVPDT